MSFKYVKKPVEIEAYQLVNHGDETTAIPQWFMHGIANGVIDHGIGGGIVIKTLEGEMKADPGDYIIRGVKGELYPCRKDIFELTYDKV